MAKRALHAEMPFPLALLGTAWFIVNWLPFAQKPDDARLFVEILIWKNRTLMSRP